MTTTQLERISELRGQNFSYQFIGEALGLSINTVKSVCRRRGIPAHGPRKTKAEKQEAALCKYCHRLLYGRSDKHFCSANCRRAWHLENRKITENRP